MAYRDMTTKGEDTRPVTTADLKGLAGRIRNLSYEDMIAFSTSLATATGHITGDNPLSAGTVASALLSVAKDLLNRRTDDD